MPPGSSSKAQQLREETPDGELPYISKSRLKTFVTCKRKFYIKYMIGFPTEDNYHLRKGTHLHEMMEEFYGNMLAAVEDQKSRDNTNPTTAPAEGKQKGSVLGPLVDYIPDDELIHWGPFADRHVMNFLKFEARRMGAASGFDEYLPVAVEEELWMDMPPMLNSPPWFGYVDLIANSSTIPEVDADRGVTIIDFKTGKVPDEQYRDDGIHLENAFYQIIAEAAGYTVSGLAGYYPQEDVVVATKPSRDRSNRVKDYITQMINIDSIDDAPEDPQPLCRWGAGDGECCDFYSDSVAPWVTPEDGKCKTPWGRKDTPVGPNYI